jgi:hypothetical protein
MAAPGRFSLGGHAGSSTWLHRLIAAARLDQEFSQIQIGNARYITLFSIARNNWMMANTDPTRNFQAALQPGRQRGNIAKLTLIECQNLLRKPKLPHNNNGISPRIIATSGVNTAEMGGCSVKYQ